MKLWRRWRCRRDKHKDVLYAVGHHPAKKCQYCSRPGILTREEIIEMQRSWPRFVQAPGGDDDGALVEVEEEETEQRGA